MEPTRHSTGSRRPTRMQWRWRCGTVHGPDRRKSRKSAQMTGRHHPWAERCSIATWTRTRQITCLCLLCRCCAGRLSCSRTRRPDPRTNAPDLAPDLRPRPPSGIGSVPARHRQERTVSVMLPNIPAMFEAHFGPPLAGAVLNTLNIRLDAESIAFMLDHAESRLLITDTRVRPDVKRALERTSPRCHRHRRRRPAGPRAASGWERPTTSAFLQEGDPTFPMPCPATNGTRSA